MIETEQLPPEGIAAETEKLPFEGSFAEALKIYSSRLRVFVQVALYSGGVLALLAYPLFVHTKLQKVLYFLCILLAFIISHGLPSIIKRITSWSQQREEIDHGPTCR